MSSSRERSAPDDETRTASGDPALAPTALPEAARLAPSAGAWATLTLEGERRYASRALLGRGGMGEVFLCDDVKIGREVALKVMRDASEARPEAGDRFLREARVQGQLDHPAVVPVYDLGLGSQGPYFTMKRVRGTRLDQLIAQLAAQLAGQPGGQPGAQPGGQPAGQGSEGADVPTRRRLLTCFVSVCLAVHFAHSRGVLHRDLKPSNVMLGDFGEVHLLDWGVAKLVGVPESAGEAGGVSFAGSGDSSTRDGAIIGTLGYMSPEQARGETERLDARSDVYSLGAMLFELLALDRLHQGPDTGSLLAQIGGGVDPRPSARSPRLGVPPELDEICAKALSLDPADRYPSARALAEAVEHYLDGDRDLALRRELAEKRLERAKRLADEAGAGGEGASRAHEQAMVEVTRSLALSPDDAEAAALLARLLVDAPAQMPPEAERDFEEHLEQRNRAASRMSIGRVVAPLLVMTLMLVPGVKSWPAVALPVSLAATTVSLVLYWLVVRKGEGRGSLPYLAFVGSCSVIATLSGVFGPFVVVPMALGLQQVAAIVGTGARVHPVVLALPALLLVASVGLSALGVFPPAITAEPDRLIIHARAVYFGPTWTPIALCLIHVLLLTLPVALFERFHRASSAMERRVFLQAWHLRRLARASTGSPK